MNKGQVFDQIDPIIIEEYSVKNCIGQGGYGKVWKVIRKLTKQVYALKKVYDAFKNDTDSQRAYRQIKYLQLLQHPNIVNLQSFYLSNNQADLYLILQYMESDLSSAIRSNVLQNIHKHFIFYQICNGVKFLHSAQLIHRDLKPTNILINQNCEVKICDFGLIRSLQPGSHNKDIKFTENIATRWYRAPQILLCTNKYGKSIDIWGLGCILAQIFIGKPIFQGTSAVSQLQKIFQITGKPSRQELYFVKSQASKSIVQSININSQKSISQVIQNKDKLLLDLLQKIFVIDPAKRITIEQIMQHPFVNIFQGKVQEKITEKYIKILYDDTKLSPKQYRALLLQQIKQNIKIKSQPSTFNQSSITQSLKNISQQSIFNNSKQKINNGLSPEKNNNNRCNEHIYCNKCKYNMKLKQDRNIKGSQSRSFLKDKVQNQLKVKEVQSKQKFQKKKPFLIPKCKNNMLLIQIKGLKSVQKQKKIFLIQNQRSNSPKINIELFQKHKHRSQEKNKQKTKDEFIYKSVSNKRQNLPQILNISSEKRIFNRSNSPSFPVQLIKSNKKINEKSCNFIKKQKIVPKFILNRTRLKSKSPKSYINMSIKSVDKTITSQLKELNPKTNLKYANFQDKKEKNQPSQPIKKQKLKLFYQI